MSDAVKDFSLNVRSVFNDPEGGDDDADELDEFSLAKFESENPCANIDTAIVLVTMPENALNAAQNSLGCEIEAVKRAKVKFDGVAKYLSGEGSILDKWQKALLEGETHVKPIKNGNAPTLLRVWQDFPRLVFGARFRGFPALGAAWDRFTRSGPEAKAKKRAIDAAYRARPEIRVVLAKQKRARRAENRSAYLAQPWLIARTEKRDIFYHRPFIAVDSEGMKYPGQDIVYNGVSYPLHSSFLWGAAGVERTAPPSEGKPHGEFGDLPLTWLGHDDKRPLNFLEIAEFLLGLPALYGDAIFVSFYFTYDATMLLQALMDYLPTTARGKVWQICKKEKMGKTAEGLKIKVKGAVYCGDYAIDWIKGKRFVLKQFRDRNNPKAGFLRKIVIYDTFGFYQKPFVASVMKSLLTLGLATQEEFDKVSADKERRKDFAQVPLAEIEEYTELEVRKLSLSCIKLRHGFDFMGLRMSSWSGAGAAAAALIKKQGVSAHYHGFVSKRDPSPEQLIAHATYYGGHIEMFKQGVLTTGGYVYDIRGAYPSEMPRLESMIGGSFRHWEMDLGIMNWSRMLGWEQVENSSKISSFFVTWSLPPFYVDKATGVVRGVPFFPLPYRLPGGGILFPSRGCGWYSRDDIIGAKRWLEKFVSMGLTGVDANGMPATIPASDAKALGKLFEGKRMATSIREHGLHFTVTKACFFDPAPDQPKPYAFLPGMYEERTRLKREEPGNVAEQTIKLTTNSLSGKAAQSVGGSEDKPPATACPWYAAATTAGTRRRVMEAMLQDPHAIVQSATDGIVSLVPLELDIGENLGQWEVKHIRTDRPAIFVQSGLYTYTCVEDKETTFKTRGIRKAETQTEWMPELVPGAWNTPACPNDEDSYPKLSITTTEFMTAGSAVVGEERFKVMGRWASRPRVINVHIPGLKRQLNVLKPELYYGTIEQPARRCFEPVETLPAANPVENPCETLSKTKSPKWLETGEITFVNEFGIEDDEETGEIWDNL
jgi:hypothetical protein